MCSKEWTQLSYSQWPNCVDRTLYQYIAPRWSCNKWYICFLDIWMRRLTGYTPGRPEKLASNPYGTIHWWISFRITHDLSRISSLRIWILQTRQRENTGFKPQLEIWNGAMLTTGGPWPVSSEIRTQCGGWPIHALNKRRPPTGQCSCSLQVWHLGLSTIRTTRKKEKQVTHEAYTIRRHHSPEHKLWNHTGLDRIPAKPLPSIYPEGQAKV